ncbi:putative ABC transport system permease protein [Catenibacillus scindens]|uniref:Putative ABC transport system permease protein n=1 Tax=Catenibacillus scindens TaxID=673271 RepID=A0A7W8HAD4_9FIRM|nr:ABC transporter permease [Catenibacillus scindens]MBB5264363.1 putative ABC transport system permease protein [Catenibacillus scindens]
MTVLLGVLEQGLIYGIMALGVYITYKILDFPDLTVDGSFPLGAAVAAVLIKNGINPYLSLLAAFAAGILAGICTGLIHVKLKVRDLLSGIIMMTALYTINLKIAGQANIPLFTSQTIFNNDFINGIIPNGLRPYMTLIIILIITLIAKYLLDLYMNTRSGYLLRAVGDNDTLVTCLAKDKGLVKIVGLAISNGLVALGGAVYAHEEGYFDISSGTGTMVIGLASVIIGTNLFKNVTILRVTSSVLIGSILYKACVAIALNFLEPDFVKLITAALLLIILVISHDRKKKVKINA